MANEIGPQQKSGQTRRSFLAKMGLGAVALAIAGGPLGMLGRLRGGQEKAAAQEFPNEDSIFHPASDPRRDPRRNG
ncbi:MAG: twin-arginine translocation signal domain-containing protein [Chloroflexi bacterium]|nr:twin-arginine translocation signal domain-containing protein [Chloroflexota bacterium]